MEYLGQAAPGINKTFTSLPGFSASSEKFFKNLGKTAKPSGPALLATKPLLARLKKLGSAALPASANLESLFGGPAQHGRPRAPARLHLPRHRRRQRVRLARALPAHRRARQRLPDLPTRARPSPAATTTCSRPARAAPRPRPPPPARPEGSGIDAATEGVVMARTLAVIKGDTPEQAIAEYPGRRRSGIEVLLRRRELVQRRRDRGAELRLEGRRQRLDHAEGRRRGLRQGSAGGEAAAQLPARR